jgi:hypothetical protein
MEGRMKGGIAEGETMPKNRMGRVGIPEIDEVMTGRQRGVRNKARKHIQMDVCHVGATKVLRCGSSGSMRIGQRENRNWKNQHQPQYISGG